MALSIEYIILTVFTLMIFTMVVRDNPLSRIAEHIALGIGGGYVFLLALKFVYATSIMPLVVNGQLVYLIPIFLGFLLYSVLFRKHGWMARYPMAVLVGALVGVAAPALIAAQILLQINASVLPIVGQRIDVAVNNIVIILCTVAVLFYFIFTTKAKGVGGKLISIARYAMMLAFGATFGNYMLTVTSRFVERIFAMLFP